MTEITREDYKKASDYAKQLENYLGNFANGMKYATDDFPEDIRNAFRGIAGNIRSEADKVRRMKEKYERKS